MFTRINIFFFTTRKSFYMRFKKFYLVYVHIYIHEQWGNVTDIFLRLTNDIKLRWKLFHGLQSVYLFTLFFKSPNIFQTTLDIALFDSSRDTKDKTPFTREKTKRSRSGSMHCMNVMNYLIYSVWLKSAKSQFLKKIR